VIWVVKAIGPISTLAGAGMGELVAVGDPGTGVGVAEGAGAGVKVEGAVVAVAGGNGVSVGGSWVVATTT